MKRVLLAAGVVAALAASANAAGVNLFYSSPAAINGATSGSAALTLGVNPVVPAGVGIPIDLWMAIPTAAPTIAGMGLDSTAAGGSTGSAFLYDNSTGRWQAAISSNGAAGSIWAGFAVNTLGTPVGPGGLQPTGAGEGVVAGLLMYHLGSGTINAAPGDSIYLQISDFASIGTGAGANALAAFGFDAAGSPDTSGYFTADGSPAEGAGSAAGFVADGALNGPVSTRIADLTVVPEPTTIALLGLAGLFIRRRK